MRLRDVRISRQLNGGLGIILLLVILMGFVALQSSRVLWTNTKGLYDHPLTVQKAIGEVKSDVMYIRLEMKELILGNDVHLIPERIRTIDTHEADIYRGLDILYGAYLGPKSDIDAVFNSVVQWKSVRDETIRLLQAGELEKARNRVVFDGEGGVQAEKILTDIEVVRTFANNKALQFYEDARQLNDRTAQQLVAVIIGILLLSVGIGTLLRKGILIPLGELTAATHSFQKGNLETRCPYESENEFGILSEAFNGLADTVQNEIENKENITRISAAMTLQNDLHLFCGELLKSLLQYTGSQMGAIYLLNREKTDYQHFESIGLGPDRRMSFAASSATGEFGMALADREIQMITDIPADTSFTFSAVSGNFRPKEIITIPVLNDTEVVAIISLANLQSYPESVSRLLNDIWREMNARLNGVLAFQKVNDYSYRLQHTNTELEVQTKELVMQADELAQQNMELEMQKKLLDEASQLKSSFLSNMSHELRTPLNSVIALTSVLNRRLRGTIPEEEYSYLDVIERNGKNLLALVNDILDLSRIEAGKEEVCISCFTLKELVGEIVEMLMPQAQEKEIRLLNQIADDLPSINSDFTMCRHILQNIISNAVKFIREGSVEISAAAVDSHIYVYISDTGIGIAEDQLHYIFDEFRQVDETTARKFGGTGLGLAIAKKYAGLLKGSIAVKSTLGEGSLFTVKLPLTIGSSDAVVSIKTQTPGSDHRLHGTLPHSSGYGKSILLVEDSEPAIIQMKDILTEQGYHVRIARNGKDALESIHEKRPDAMILDLMMPEVDGFDVLKVIRSVEDTSHIPVLILTAKHVTKQELSFLAGNHIFQLIQKGSIGKVELLTAVSDMVFQETEWHPVHEEPPLDAPFHERPLILIVEDNSDNRTTVKALLQETCDILEAVDGPSGIEQARTHSPTLILLDISLPIMDGFQVLEALKEDETTRHIPVMALTARAMKGDREEILAYGFNGYVSKPIDEKILVKTIRRILDAG